MNVGNNYLEEQVEIRAMFNIPSLISYKKWTKVSRFLAVGLVGIEVREIKHKKLIEDGRDIQTKTK